MTDQEWFSAIDPTVMLEFIRDKSTDRKLRLFACACVRRISDSVPDDHRRKAVEAAEQYAEGIIGDDELSKAHNAATRSGRPWTPAGVAARWTAWPKWVFAGSAMAAAVARVASISMAYHTARSSRKSKRWKAARNAERDVQCTILRDVIGNPFRTENLDSVGRNRTVKEIAEIIYAERAFDRLSMLGDALEDAGCTSDDMLNHCRQPGVHVRGCWTLDLILNKK